MKISSSDMVMTASHTATQVQDINESLHVWIDKKADQAQNQAQGAGANSLPDTASSTVHISDGARAASQNNGQNNNQSNKQAIGADQTAVAGSSEAQAISDASTTASHDPMLWLIKQVLEYFLGEKINLFDSSKLTDGAASAPAAAPDPAAAKPAAKKGWGLEYDKTTTTTESEKSTFQASGVINTEDGKSIKFNLSFDLQRSYSEQSSVHVRAGDAKSIDPLVVNFSGGSIDLTSTKFAFDLDSDGKKENISFVQGGGFLALDKNGDGKINDGSELFGPSSGNGFSELSTLDSDGNGWIDENDTAFQDLKVWTKDASGADKLTSLKDAGVGALYLGNTESSFQFKDAQNNSQGQLRSSGVWLSDDGKAGALQQIDLTV